MSAQVSKDRFAGVTERNWCQAVHGGTGITVLAILTSKNPDTPSLRTALHSLQNSHSVLRSRLHYNPKSNTYSFVTSISPFIQIKTHNLSATQSILGINLRNQTHENISPFHLILEHELNENAWVSRSITNDQDVLFASSYALPEGKWVLVLRLHVAACDRTTAVSLLRELLELMGEEEGGGGTVGSKGEVTPTIEDLIPSGKAKKTLWARGVDMLGYSVNSLRLTNLKFNDTKSPRSTQVVRLMMDRDDTRRILTGCKLRETKLCGALTAAGVIALQNLKCRSDHHQRKKYGVVTLTDCRSILEPSLSNHHFGFYHSAILNAHTVKGGENFWDLAKKMYAAFVQYKSGGRHFSDMADLNFLMLKAMENPALTSSSSLRSCFMTVFEETVIDNSDNKRREVGLEDYMGCASVHGIGPSIGVFDTIRDGRLDCVCVYPAPLHSREQMQELVDGMKSVLVAAATEDETVS
ncbi:hypothetical protein SLA2020_147830 [Shorea laevis]